MKTIRIILLILIIIGLGLIFTQKYWVEPLVNLILEHEEAPSGTGITEQKINFDEIGHFVKDNPGLKPGVWFLVYEKPGAAALTAELLFDEKSICRSDGKEGKCPDVFLPKSSLTRVQGILENGVVRVVSAGDSL